MVDSYNGCYRNDTKGVSGHDNNAQSASADPLVFASAFARRNPNIVRRFWAAVEKSDTCWLWTKGKDACGYGQMSGKSGQSPLRSNRVAWLITRGPIPAGAHVLHTCDVRHCVNPEHLFLGDQAANMKDAAQKYRLPGNRKLTDAQVAEIRARYVPRQNGKDLAREFHTSLVSICRIVAGTQRRARPARQGVA